MKGEEFGEEESRSILYKILSQNIRTAVKNHKESDNKPCFSSALKMKAVCPSKTLASVDLSTHRHNQEHRHHHHRRCEKLKYHVIMTVSEDKPEPKRSKFKNRY